MKKNALKYYLRGLGIGVAVTALISGLAHMNTRPMTDEEVKERASQLGMIEGKTLSEGYGSLTIEPSVPQENDHPNIIVPTEGIDSDIPATTLVITPEGESTITIEPVIEDISEVPTEAPTEVPTEVPTEAPTKVPTEVPTQAPTEAPTLAPTKAPASGDTYVVSVVRGDSSGSVCKRMEQAGIIESAKDFDAFLCKKGYDTHLAFGEHEISADMTYEEMAQILMGR